MDYQKFIEQLPGLYENWGQPSVSPKSQEFQAVLDQVQGLTTANVMQLLNFAVECMEPDEVYCEVGCFQGATLIGALLNHPELRAYAVDNFSEFDESGQNFEQLSKNLSKFGLDEQVIFCNQDFEEFFFELREIKESQKIGVYMYDGAHDYRSQLVGLMLARSFLADKALIIMEDTNRGVVQQANWDFMAAHPQCKLLLDLPTPKNGDCTFWNGVQVFRWDVDRENGYKWLNFVENYRNMPLIRGMNSIGGELELNKKKEALEALEQEALTLEASEQLVEAEQKYKEILQGDRNNAKAYHNLGTIYYRQEKYRDALEMLRQAVSLDREIGLHHYELGVVLEKLGNNFQAIEAYKKALALNPELVDAYNNLGNILYTGGELEQAESIYRQACAAFPNHFGSYLNLGNVLLVKCQIDEAIAAYSAARELQPDNPDILDNLEFAQHLKNDNVQALTYSGNYLAKHGKYQEAIKQYQKILPTESSNASFHLIIGECHEYLYQYKEAIEVYREGIRIYPVATTANLYWRLTIALREVGNTEEAIQVASDASILFPDDILWQFKKYFSLPVLYKEREEIEVYRHRVTRGLEEISQQISLETPEAKQNALRAIGQHSNFFIAYQGLNHLEWQKQYGQMVHRIMAANYPQWTPTPTMPPLSRDGKIRIGYISCCMFGHTVGKLARGWLRYHDRNQFEIYCYHINRMQDEITELFRLDSDRFHHIPDNLEAVCEQIIADRLHVLVFLEIGMQPQMTQLASLRLAPLQCTTWCHPETSGLPTVDYFLSSELMEPENAKSHYSEELIGLPNIGISYPKPTLPSERKTRTDLQLRNDAVVYLSCQILIKYLPQHDYIFAKIAQRVPDAQFVFIPRPNAYIAEQFWQRLQKAFASFDMNAEEYCKFLPRLNPTDYFNLNLVSDIYLDSFSWSGGHTTLEAIACNLPVVTCPGEFMRGRHSYGILKMLGVTETIANNEAEYIEIAARLGLDKEWRQSIVEKIRQNHNRLYDDKTCVEALEAFYRRVVRKVPLGN